MTELPAFGARLARFIEFRNLDAATLNSVSARELQTVIEGSAPSAHLLLRLAPAPPRRYEPGPGSFLLGMLENRNLARWYTAKSVYLGNRGHIYLSETTVQHALAHSKRLTPDMFGGFAVVLGLPVADLAALTGFDLPTDTFPAPPSPTISAELIWCLRRLSSDQARHVTDVARAMQAEIRPSATP